MDPVTHAVAGLAIAWTEPSLLNIAPDSMEAKAIFWAALLGSQAPDSDFIFRATGSVNYLKFHRVLTHGVFALPILALVIALFLSLFFTMQVFWLVFITAAISILAHIFLDMLTAYGTLIFWPLKHRAYAWNLLMIIDPVLLLTPILAKLLVEFEVVPASTGAYGGLLIVATYLMARLHIHSHIEKCVKKFFAPCDRVAVLPNYLGMFKWKFVIKKEDKYFLGNIQYPLCKIKNINFEQCSDNVDTKYLNIAQASRTAQAFLQFAKFPLLRYRKLSDGHLFQWTDLRYRFKGYEFFVAMIFVDNEGNILEENLGDIGGGRA